MKLYVYKVNVFIVGQRQIFFKFIIYSICEGRSSSFPLRPRKPRMTIDFRTEAEDGKVLSALCKYCPEVEHNDFMQEARSRNIEGSAFYLDLS